MDLPLFISAEAAVKSNRSDYLSIFDPAADVTTMPLKRFYSDPDLVKQAVQRLKDAGFSVYTIDKTTISISAPVGIINSAFNVELIMEEQAPSEFMITVRNQTEKGFIPTIGTSYDDVLAGILIDQGGVTFSCTERQPPEGILPAHEAAHLFLEDIIPKLGGQSNSPSGDKVDVHIIDSGVDPDHPFFKKEDGTQKFSNEISRKSIQDDEFELGYLRDIRDNSSKLAKAKSIFNDVKGDVDMYGNAAAADPNQIKEMLSTFRIVRNLFPEEHFNDFVDSFPNGEINEENLFFLDTTTFNNTNLGYINERLVVLSYLKDPQHDFHGTIMSANFLSVAPNAYLTVWMKEKDDLNNWKNTFKAAGSCDGIISCSWGTIKKNYSQNELRFWRSKTVEAVQQKITILFAAGNGKDKNKSIQARCLAGQPGVIIVGGAYYDTDDILKASDICHGYYDSTNMIPDICGLSGPNEESNSAKPGWIWAPWRKSPCWELSAGSSGATAQVAGVCALVKQIWRKISPEDLKKILIESATPITQGASAQGVPFGGGDGQINAGLVNIHGAVQLARFCNLFSSVNKKSVDETLALLETNKAEINDEPLDLLDTLTFDKGKKKVDFDKTVAIILTKINL